MLVRVGLPLVALEGCDEEELVAGDEGVEVGAGAAVGVVLDEEVEVAGFVCESWTWLAKCLS